MGDAIVLADLAQRLHTTTFGRRPRKSECVSVPHAQRSGNLSGKQSVSQAMALSE